MTASDEPRRSLPTPIKTRLAETRRHAVALKALLDTGSESEYVAAAEAGTTEELIAAVYPLERAFEILANFVLELAEQGLVLAGVVPEGSKARVLEQLEAQGVVSRKRRDALGAIHRVRNEMQHMYPDARAAAVHAAAASLLEELGPFFSAYARWLRKLGYG